MVSKELEDGSEKPLEFFFSCLLNKTVLPTGSVVFNSPVQLIFIDPVPYVPRDCKSTNPFELPSEVCPVKVGGGTKGEAARTLRVLWWVTPSLKVGLMPLISSACLKLKLFFIFAGSAVKPFQCVEDILQLASNKWSNLTLCFVSFGLQ